MPDFLIALLIIFLCLALAHILGLFDRKKKSGEDDKPYKQWWGRGL